MNAAAALAITALAVVAAAGAVVASGRDAPRREQSMEFQRIVGGLGLGPSIDLGVCEPDFDPRVGAVCAGATDPIPCGAAFCGHHGGAALVR